MKRLILVGPLPPPYYGQSVSFKMLVEGAAERGYTCDIVNIAQGSRTADSIGQATFQRALEYAGVLPSYVRAILQARTTVYITIAQSRHGFIRDFVMIWLARSRGHEVVAHLKGGNYGRFFAGQPRWLQGLIKVTLRKCKHILVLGEGLRAMFDFDPVVLSRVEIVPNGLPTALDGRNSPKELPRSRGEPVNVLYLSNLVESKGYLDVLEAINELVNERGIDTIRCHFAGAFLANPADDRTVRGPAHAEEMFRERVATYGLHNHVVMHGVVTGAAKQELLDRAHFFVLPTNYNNEGQPVSIIEAIAAGNVVIATNYRAIPDMVIDNHTGFLVPYGAPNKIADAIEQCISNPAKYTAMSANALELFRRKFTRRAHLDTILRYLG